MWRLVGQAARLGPGLLILCYPFLVYLGLAYLDARSLALVLIGLAAARLVARRPGEPAMAMPQVAMLSLAAAALVGFAVVVSGSPDQLRLYPVAINVGMLLLFAATLVRPPSMIERIARLREPDLGADGVHYTRVVTEVWCGFFLLNGAVALYTAVFSELEVWMLYNGLIAYLLMAGLFGGEMLVRRRVMRGSRATLDAP